MQNEGTCAYLEGVLGVPLSLGDIFQQNQDWFAKCIDFSHGDLDSHRICGTLLTSGIGQIIYKGILRSVLEFPRGLAFLTASFTKKVTELV